MKIEFDDTSYLEVSLLDKEKIQVTLAAKNGVDSQKYIINSAEISLNQFFEIAEKIKLQLNS